ncbi:hypothetical protein M569_05884, partial [Genlisea aurea]
SERNPLVVSGVVGDVLDTTCITSLRVSGSDGSLLFSGSTLRPSQLALRPKIDIGGDNFRTFYTLVMVDADAPSPSNPYHREYLHWLITDIPGTTSPIFGNEIVSYEPPQPTMGIHRLVLMLFRQQGRGTVNFSADRKNFNTKEFCRRNGISPPFAAAFYNCQGENGCGGRRA